MSIYDQVNVWGKDDEFRLKIITAGNPKTICDLGCGTGRLTLFMAKEGTQVWGIDPDGEAIAEARKKKGANKITWIVGTSEQMRGLTFDRVSMTANVAQEIVDDTDWIRTLQDSYDALNVGGKLVFDCRNPKAKAWEKWTKEYTLAPVRLKDGTEGAFWYEVVDTGCGRVTCVAFIEVNNAIISDEEFSIRFRSLEDVKQQVLRAGFTHLDVYGDWEERSADETSREFLFVATK